MSKTPPTDEQLMHRVQRGKERAFAELYDRYGNRVYGYCYRALWQNADLAADVTQEVFLRVVEQAGRFDTGRNFRAWLFTITANLVRNEYRRHERHQTEPLLPETAVPVNYDRTLDGITFDRYLDLALEQLHETERQIILLRYREEMTVPQIAAILDCPLGSVKSKLHYTLKKLEKRLGAFREIDRHA